MSDNIDAASDGWVKSSFSNASACVELKSGAAAGGVDLRDSKLGSRSPILSFTHREMQAFLLGAKAGEFDHLLD